MKFLLLNVDNRYDLKPTLSRINKKKEAGAMRIKLLSYGRKPILPSHQRFYFCCYCCCYTTDVICAGSSLNRAVLV